MSGIVPRQSGKTSALDRIALAAELSELAVRFVDESRRWADSQHEGATACVRTAEILHQQARVLDDPAILAVDLARARGLADAATQVLGQLDGARRFLRSARAVDGYLQRAERRR